MAHQPKVALVSSIGGHLTDLLAVREALGEAERFWVLQDRTPVLPAGERAYLVAHAERDLKVLLNFAEFAAIFSREQPDLVISAGAGIAIPAAIIARAAGVPVIYVEPSSSVKRLSLTGKLMKRLATSYFVQWPDLRAFVAHARYDGGLL